MKTTSILFALILLGSNAFSQELKTIIMPNNSRAESSVVIDGVTTHNYSTGKSIPVNGTPFLTEQFSPGVLELHDGKKSEEILLRYNIAQDLFEILRSNDTLTINRPFDLKYVYMNDKTFIYDPKLREDVDRKYNGFFEILVDGKLSLLKKRNKDLSFHSFAGNYQGGAGTKEYYFVDKVSFVVKTSTGKVFLINSQKNLLKNLDDHKADVKDFIKKQDIRFKKDEDLIKLIKYYNQL